MPVNWLAKFHSIGIGFQTRLNKAMLHGGCKEVHSGRRVCDGLGNCGPGPFTGNYGGIVSCEYPKKSRR